MTEPSTDRSPAGRAFGLLRVGIVAPQGSQTLDIIGPIDAFTEANHLAEGGPAYAVELLGTSAAPIVTASGTRLLPDRSIAEAGTFDTLLVAGSPDIAAAGSDPALLSWLARQAQSVRRLGSICNGSFILAAAGLLDGRRATTHWRFAARLAQSYPRTRVDLDRLFVRDGPIYTSAGATAGIDLALSLIEEDLGRATSLAVARELVVFLRRPGGQAQFSTQLMAQTTRHPQLQDMLEWAMQRLDQQLSVGRLAQQAAMSQRNLARLFQTELGVGPAHFIEMARVEQVRILLETSDLSLQRIATHCGFASVDTLRRAFMRQLNVSPSSYRHRFTAC